MSSKRAFEPIPVTIDEDEDRRVADYARRSGIPEVRRPVAVAQSADVPLHVTVPDYVLKGLKVKAAQEGVSVRFLVLKALNESGAVSIPEVDLIGDRRAKKGSR